MGHRASRLEEGHLSRRALDVQRLLSEAGLHFSEEGEEALHRGLLDHYDVADRGIAVDLTGLGVPPGTLDFAVESPTAEADDQLIGEPVPVAGRKGLASILIDRIAACP